MPQDVIDMVYADVSNPAKESDLLADIISKTKKT